MRRDIQAFVPLVALLVVLSSLMMMHSCTKEVNDDNDIYEPITVVEPDSVVTRLKQKEGLPLQIKFVTDRPIVYAQALYSIDSTNSETFDLAGSDTIFVLYDSIPFTNKKDFVGDFKPDSIKVGHKVRVQISMQALGNAGVVAPSHYFEKYMRIDVIK